MQPASTALKEEKVVDGFPVAELSPKQLRQWNDTLSMMSWAAPGFLNIQYRLLNAQNNASNDYVALFTRQGVDIAATDGINLLYNPDTFFEHKLAQRVYINTHEILHVVRDDVTTMHVCQERGHVLFPDGSKLPYVHDTANRAMDAVINALLDESNIGERPTDKDGKEIGIHDPTVKATDSWFDVYKKYYKKPPEGQGDKPGQPGQGQGQQQNQPQSNKPGRGFDQVLKPGQASGKTPQQAKDARNPQQWKVEIAQAQKLEHDNKADDKGNMPAGLDLLFRNLLEPEISWIDKVETKILRKFGDGAIEWTQPHPWFGAFEFFVPAETGKSVGWTVMWGDSSGSHMQESIITKCISEMAGVFEQLNPSRLTLLWCDAKVQNVHEITDAADLRTVKPKGGGGTDYKPVLDWIAKNSRGDVPDLFIGFTDGIVDHPKKPPPFPVIWVSTTDAKYPFGDVVRVNNIRKGA